MDNQKDTPEDIKRERTRKGGRALDAIYYLDLALPELAIMLFIGSECDFKGDFLDRIAISRKAMTARLKLKSHKTLDRHILNLEKRGYLSVTRRKDAWGVWKTSEYALTRKVFDDYDDWLLQNGIKPEAASFKRSCRGGEMRTGEIYPRAWKNLPEGERIFTAGSSEKSPKDGEIIPSFSPVSSPSSSPSLSPSESTQTVLASEETKGKKNLGPGKPESQDQDPREQKETEVKTRAEKFAEEILLALAEFGVKGDPKLMACSVALVNEKVGRSYEWMSDTMMEAVVYMCARRGRATMEVSHEYFVWAKNVRERPAAAKPRVASKKTQATAKPGSESCAPTTLEALKQAAEQRRSASVI